MPAASSLPRFYLQLSCLAGGLVAVAGWQAASTAGDEPPGAKVLRLGATAAAAMLIAQLLLDKESGTGSTIIELPADSTATLREDWGKSTMAPVHIGRAKTTSSPIVEGTSRTMANTDNPRGLSFLPAAAAAAIPPPPPRRHPRCRSRRHSVGLCCLLQRRQRRAAAAVYFGRGCQALHA